MISNSCICSEMYSPFSLPGSVFVHKHTHAQICLYVCDKARLTVSENSEEKKKSFQISFSISGGESYCVLIREKDEIIKAILQSTESACISMLSLLSHLSHPPSIYSLFSFSQNLSDSLLTHSVSLICIFYSLSCFCCISYIWAAM